MYSAICATVARRGRWKQLKSMDRSTPRVSLGYGRLPSVIRAASDSQRRRSLEMSTLAGDSSRKRRFRGRLASLGFWGGEQDSVVLEKLNLAAVQSAVDSSVSYIWAVVLESWSPSPRSCYLLSCWQFLITTATPHVSWSFTTIWTPFRPLHYICSSVTLTRGACHQLVSGEDHGANTQLVVGHIDRHDLVRVEKL